MCSFLMFGPNSYLGQLLPVETLPYREQEGEGLVLWGTAVTLITKSIRIIGYPGTLPGDLLVQYIICGTRELGFAFMDGLYFLGQGLREEAQVPSSPSATTNSSYGHGVGCGAGDPDPEGDSDLVLYSRGS